MAFYSGHGSTLGFGTTTTFTPQYTSIGGWGASRETLDTSTLATTGSRTYIGGDLFAIDPFTATYYIDPAEWATGEDCCIDDLIYDSGSVSAAETVTITLPTSDTEAASAAVVGFTREDLVTDTVIAASISVQWLDWPTITDAV